VVLELATETRIKIDGKKGTIKLSANEKKRTRLKGHDVSLSRRLKPRIEAEFK
jgi:hypothetical protein